MRSIEHDGGGRAIEGTNYTLAVAAERKTVLLTDREGRPWADLLPIAAADPIDGRDETSGWRLARVEAADDAVRLSWALESSRWARSEIVIDCEEDGLSIRLEIDGGGRLGRLRLLGGHVASDAGETGPRLSGRSFETLLSGAPQDPGRLVRSAGEPAANRVSGGAKAGQAGWFFSPGPFVFAMSREPPGDGRHVPSGPWLSFGLGSDSTNASFVGVDYQAGLGGFAFELDYEGQTVVDGAWHSPVLRIAPAHDPYAAIGAHREWLARTGRLSPARGASRRPADWWREPMFCGWGAQSAMARAAGLPFAAAKGYATQANYDRWLGRLADAGIEPGTIVIDDKWQATYGSNEPDPAKWADLRGWIARRHDDGQRVLLWWKAWDPEGLPAEACVRRPDGTPVAIDPETDAARELVGGSIRRLLAPDGLDADGLKIDFTAATPSGSSLAHAGPSWGSTLLRSLLGLVREAADRAKPDALLIGQVVEPSLAGDLDMIRLNDMLRLDEPEPAVPILDEMVHRARIVRAACPDHLLDTDDWCVPDRAEWRAWAARKPELGVPSLYYVDRLDLSGEQLTGADHELVRTTWAAYRADQGLPGPRPRRPAGL